MTTTTRLRFIQSLAIALITASMPAAAQQAPSDAQLQMPASSSPAQAAAPSPMQTAGQRYTRIDPCPLPTAAAKETPDDLAKVQEEIDRYTLCVQRAQLLERLNESAAKNDASNDAAMGYTPSTAAVPSSMPGLPGAQVTNAPMPALPANALAGADVSPMANKTPSKDTKSASADDEAPTPAPEAPKEWTIREIYGSGDNVQAKLVSPEGDEVRAHSGMKLPDGKTTVVRITPAGVTVRGSSGAKPLEWARS